MPLITQKKKLHAHAKALQHFKKNDPILAHGIQKMGLSDLKSRPAPNLFTPLLSSIIYQQLAGSAAKAIHGRVVALFKNQGTLDPSEFMAMRETQLRAAGLSQNKMLALKDLAAKCINGTIPTIQQAKQMTDEELVELLTQVRGIGPWTVHMLLIFVLGRKDVMPSADYGVRNGYARLYRKRALPKPKDLEKHAERWRPYRSIASWYLWRVVDTKL